MFDLVIKDAEINHGAGNAAVRGDLGNDRRYHLRSAASSARPRRRSTPTASR